ncbi:hypothetical protein [Parapedobacter koreensis]|uniref:Uncharacterized protein n=1 Tax=Parapedobacter koreensis TaxID=332977 RepID=A0A1H7NSS5_9SPHI|nr:hypothetical protein [Parapedobacter koreensis]SEL26593.1 hypothetical protein SAMN05421740_10493 [Parapedobacter koreensis]
MNNKTFRQTFLKLLALVTVCFAGFGFTAKMGLDSYEIYLNNTLILKQFVNQPLNLRKLQLDKAKESDQLRIYYTHCTNKGVGTGRRIVINDQQGHALKTWEFADVNHADGGMVITVKALRELEKRYANRQLSLHYLTDEHPQGELLARVALE